MFPQPGIWGIREASQRLSNYGQEIANLFKTLKANGVAEDRVMVDASLGLEENGGIVKCWFVFDRRRRAIRILQNEDFLAECCSLLPHVFASFECFVLGGWLWLRLHVLFCFPARHCA